MIRAVNLVKEYEGGTIRALAGVSLDVAKGEYAAIMGPSGSGKTTLLNMIGALDVPTSGEVWIDGAETTKAADLDDLRARKVGFIFQLHNLIPTMTARENVEVPMVPTRVPRPERRTRALELLEAVGLAGRADQRVTQMSGGERQRVAIARALANRPPILLADEPTGDLDTKTGEAILKVIHDVRRKLEMTLVVVTHNPDVCAGADRVVQMRDGRIHEVVSSAS